MQEKYLGDTPDFGKYALLRALCNKRTGLRLGINWYLTIGSEVDKPDNRDGHKRHHATNPETYKPIDPELWELLAHFQLDEHRSLTKFESSGVLQNGTLYHSEPLSLADAKGKERKLQVRSLWVQAALKKLESADLVFVDPDNGFEGSAPRHYKQGPKFTYYDEIKGFIERNQTVVAIQFMGHQAGGVPALVSAIKHDLRTKLSINGDIHVLRNSAGTSILYFIIPAEHHSVLISKSIGAFLDGPASSVFEWVNEPCAVTDENDDEIRQIIYSRYQHIFDNPELVVAIPMVGPAMGAPPREWIPKAIDKIERLIDSGLSINEACRKVEKGIIASENIAPKTVEMTYRRYQREYWNEEFCRCVITKDIEGAVTAYKRLTPAIKRKRRID
jgi:hypothetical protein